MGDTFQVAYALQNLGASTVVMRSLFPEQMPSSFESETSAGDSPAGRTADFPEYAEHQLSPESDLRQVECLKEMLTIPVIASLNGHRPAGWMNFALRLENAGGRCHRAQFPPSRDPEVLLYSIVMRLMRNWWTLLDSNQRPFPCQGNALTN